MCLAVLAALVIQAVRDARPLGRSIALITLLAVVANPYASFYDGFILIVPGTLWLAHRDEYPGRTWWIVGAWIGAYWFWDMAVFYYAGTRSSSRGSRSLSGGTRPDRLATTDRHLLRARGERRFVCNDYTPAGTGSELALWQ